MVHLNVEMHNTRNSEDIVYSLLKYKVLRDIDKLYYFKREYNITRELSNTSDEAKALVAEIWNDIYESNHKNGFSYKDLLKGIKDNKAKKFRKAVDKIHKTYGENISDDQLNLYLNRFEIERPSSELYTYWKEARLEGTYQQAFDTYLENNPDVAKRLEDLQIKWKTTLETVDMNTDITNMSASNLNNLFIDVIQQRTNDINSFDARFTPGGFDPLKSASDMLKAIKYGGDKYRGNKQKLIKDAQADNLEDYEPSLDPTNPITSAIYNARNIVAGKVIGIMANHNINFAYSRILKEFKLNTPIALLGKNATNLIGYNESQSADPELMLAMLLASSVDAVKAPVLNYLNINTHTANIAALLARTGYSGFEIGLFLNQPIIMQLCDYMSESGRTNLSSVCKTIAQMRGVKDFKADMVNISEDTLYNNLYEENGSDQIKVLQTFAFLAKQAQALSDFISQTKYTASNSVDNTVGSLVATMYDINNANSDTKSNIAEYLTINLGIEGTSQLSPILNTYFKGKDSKLEAMTDKESYFKFLMNTPFAIEQIAHDSMEAYLEALSKYFPYSTSLYTGIYDTINRLSLRGNLSSELVNIINSNIPVFLLASQEGGKFNPNTPVWVNTETGEISWIDKSGLEEWSETTAEGYFTVDFTRNVVDFIEDLQSIINKNKEFDAKLVRYESIEDQESDNAVALMEELEELNAEIENLENELTENYKHLIGGMDISEVRNNLLLNSLDYEAETVPYIDPETGIKDEGIKYSLRLSNNNQFDNNIKSDITNSWELLFDKSPIFATYLYMSNFFNRGFDVGLNVFNNVTPVQVLESLGINSSTSYLQWIQQLVEGNVSTPEKFKINNFLKLFYRNNYDNYALVKNIYDTDINASSAGNVNTLKDPFTGNNIRLNSDADANTITINIEKGFENSIFALREGVINTDKSGGKFIQVIPAFTINVEKAGTSTKVLYVLKSPVDNSFDVKGGIVTYERIDLPSDKYSLSYSNDALNGREDNTTLLESQTKNEEIVADRATRNSTPNGPVRLNNTGRGRTIWEGMLSKKAADALRKGENIAREENVCGF